MEKAYETTLQPYYKAMIVKAEKFFKIFCIHFILSTKLTVDVKRIVFSELMSINSQLSNSHTQNNHFNRTQYFAMMHTRNVQDARDSSDFIQAHRKTAGFCFSFQCT